MRHIYGFHALRAIAVLLVIVSHAGVARTVSEPFWARLLMAFDADFGIRLFFVLSGFLITTSLLEETARHGRVNIRHFLVRRALRILPLFFLIMAVVAVLISAGVAEESWEAMAFGVLSVYNFIPRDEDVNYLGHLWALAILGQFYFVWPFMFTPWRHKRGALVLLCFAFIVGCLVLLRRDLGWLDAEFHMQRWTLPAVYPISIGTLLALSLDRLRHRLAHSASLVVSGALIILPAAVGQGAAAEVGSTMGMAGLIAWICYNQDSRAVRALDWEPVYYLGTISYGLYLWQGLLTGNGAARVTPAWPPDPLLGAALTLPIAALTYHSLERPLLRLRRRFSADGGRRAGSISGPDAD